LHYDNLAALIQADPALGPLRSYSTVRRSMQAHGWVRQRRATPKGRPGEERAARRREQREVRRANADGQRWLFPLDASGVSSGDNQGVTPPPGDQEQPATELPPLLKSVALRIVAERLAAVRDVLVRVLRRPQSKTADFYRELGDIFAVKLSPANRYGGFKVLRERWRAHLASSRIKPVLLIDEAQEMAAEVLRELRLLSSADFDATSLLTVVLAGDGRLVDRLRQEDLIPLGICRVHRTVSGAVRSRANGTLGSGTFSL
jgi:hypothetical protein